MSITGWGGCTTAAASSFLEHAGASVIIERPIKQQIIILIQPGVKHVWFCSRKKATCFNIRWILQPIKKCDDGSATSFFLPEQRMKWLLPRAVCGCCGCTNDCLTAANFATPVF
jgi:hypothetical protein